MHIPVLLEESTKLLLNGRRTGIYIDATLGGGGTTEKLLEQLDCSGRVISIDQDLSAIESASRRLQPYSNFTVVRENFRALDQILKKLDIRGIDGIIADLGISSMHVDDESRGFAFKSNSRLDMRMDPQGPYSSAYDLIMNLDEDSLKTIFRELGEERWAGRIASRIVETRKSKAIETPAELAKLVEEAVPKKFHSRRIHPATRIFLALRIKVNDELGVLRELLDKAVAALNPGGRMVFISYHSLEDRIVKWKFREYAALPESDFRIITKKPIIPTDEEIEANPRARSAKMRVAEKNQGGVL
ncbi:MAG: 16S rRNA (cytosine(1402)-N(4))-methyltransferase RsmH [Firmicutes bacterium]|nr:16S rRNA (cytosine(1402)-N(4))-methyltransferase RsmH [Bacillota bacterium]